MIERGPLIDIHTHVSPRVLPPPLAGKSTGAWPCMRCGPNGQYQMLLGDRPFRDLDSRSWDSIRRLEDMDRHGVDFQILSPMPELLSYWFEPDEGALLCNCINEQIAAMVAEYPRHFQGLGAVTLQEPSLAVEQLTKIRDQFGLAGVEIGSNVNGRLLGDRVFEPFWEAAESQDLAVFVHALHPVIGRSSEIASNLVTFAGFPLDVSLAAASILMAGVLDRYPALKICFSHGAGGLWSMLGRLDQGWLSGGFQNARTRPSIAAKKIFIDSNVYDKTHLSFLTTSVSPGKVIAGSDYPYKIMQHDLRGFIENLSHNEQAFSSLSHGAAESFLGLELDEHLRSSHNDTSLHLN